MQYRILIQVNDFSEELTAPFVRAEERNQLEAGGKKFSS
jgi:hypothetical protein